MRSVFLLLIAGATLQLPPAPTTPGQKPSPVHVRGCVHGSSLLLSEDPGFEVPGRKIDLQGSKKIMRMLKEHDGHQDEIVGMLKTRARNNSVIVKEKRGEKTRVYVGASETRSDSGDDLAPPPTLTVRDVIHLDVRCR